MRKLSLALLIALSQTIAMELTPPDAVIEGKLKQIESQFGLSKKDRKTLIDQLSKIADPSTRQFIASHVLTPEIRSTVYDSTDEYSDVRWCDIISGLSSSQCDQDAMLSVLTYIPPEHLKTFRLRLYGLVRSYCAISNENTRKSVAEAFQRVYLIVSAKQTTIVGFDKKSRNVSGDPSELICALKNIECDIKRDLVIQKVGELLSKTKREGDATNFAKAIHRLTLMKVWDNPNDLDSLTNLLPEPFWDKLDIGDIASILYTLSLFKDEETRRVTLEQVPSSDLLTFANKISGRREFSSIWFMAR